MKVTLMVDWRAKEILTVRQLDKRIEDRVEETIQNTDAYNEYLDDYIDSNYSKMELFEALTGSDAKREETISDIRSGVAEAIYDWMNMDVSSDFHDIAIEI